jgi:hypothetical protein
MSYIYPHIQKQLLLGKSDPNALLEVQNSPLSAPQAPLGVGMGQPSMSPYGPPMASQGMPQVDPRLQQQSQFWQGLDALAGVGRMGRSTGFNPAQQQMDQQAALYKLQSDRMRAMQQGRQDNPFYDYETAKARGYFALNEGETEAEGFRRYTQEQFKDPDKSKYEVARDDLVSSGLSRPQAAGLLNGQYEVRELPDGSPALVDKATGEVQRSLSPEEAQNLTYAAAYSGQSGQATAARADKYLGELEENWTARADLANAYTSTQELLAAIKNDDLSTNASLGFLANKIGYGTEEQGRAQVLAVMQALRNLQIVNLAPVTEAEFAKIEQMYLDLEAGEEVNIGRLRGNLDLIMQGLAKREGEYKMKRNFIMSNKGVDPGIKEYVGEFFPEIISGTDAADQVGIPK